MTETTTEVKPTDQQPVCPWCGSKVDASSSSVTVGPPPFDRGSTTHEWTLHADCANEWATVANRLHELSKRGARRTLIEYPIEQGPESLVKTTVVNREGHQK